MGNDLKRKIYELDKERVNKENTLRNKKKVKKLVRDTVTDRDTGEILKETVLQTEIFTNNAEPSYVKFYLQDLMLVNDLPNKSGGILWELVRNTNYNNKIILNGAIKKDICSDLNIKMATLNNTLTKFVQKEILYRLDTGVYMPNPYLFARGKWEDINNLRMVVNYKKNGTKTVELELDGKKAIDVNKEIEENQVL